MDMIDMTAKNIEEAVELALLELDAERGEVAVEVISHGRAGLFGIGSEPAKVRVTRLVQGAENVSHAHEVKTFEQIYVYRLSLFTYHTFDSLQIGMKNSD